MADIPLFALLAEHASINGDGTFTVLRGGIDRFMGPKFPLALQATLYVSARGVTIPPGMTPVTIAVAGPDGKHVEVVKDHMIEVRSSGTMNLIVPLVVPLLVPGKYIVGVDIGSAHGEVACNAVLNDPTGETT